MTIDKDTGLERPKEFIPAEKPVGVVPKLNSEGVVKLNPKDWFLVESTALGCLPLDKDLHIPKELVSYVNGNFNVYPNLISDTMALQFNNCLTFKNHSPYQAYGLVIGSTLRKVEADGQELIYIDIVSAINRNIDPMFAFDIENRNIKYTSFAHTTGSYICSVCSSTECEHIEQMVHRTIPAGSVSKEGLPFGILHVPDDSFEVYENSFLDVPPAYGGAISHSVIKFDKPIEVRVTREELEHKAHLALDDDEKFMYSSVIKDLIAELGI